MTNQRKKGGIYELKGEAEMNLKVNALTKRLDTLNVSRRINVSNMFIIESCSICASLMHLAQTCPSLPVFSENQMEQVNAFNDFRKQSSGLYSWEQNQPGNQGGAPQAQNQYPSGFSLTYQNHGC
jgi:hypothetical protein